MGLLQVVRTGSAGRRKECSNGDSRLAEGELVYRSELEAGHLGGEEAFDGLLV